MLGALMMQLDMTMTTIATRTLVRDFDSPLTTIQWVTTAYLLAMSATIPLAGWALERFGARAVWMTSIGMFLVGSMACGLAWSPGSLIAFRVFQGLGAGMVMPVGQAVLVQAAPFQAVLFHTLPVHEPGFQADAAQVVPAQRDVGVGADDPAQGAEHGGRHQDQPHDDYRAGQAVMGGVQRGHPDQGAQQEPQPEPAEGEDLHQGAEPQAVHAGEQHQPDEEEIDPVHSSEGSQRCT